MSNSSEFAFVYPNTSLANSTTAICIPKHIPKNGILFSLAYFIVAILPSIPLLPNPPGTIIPLYFPRTSFAFSLLIFSQFTISIFTFALLANPPCFTASITEIYESSNFTYFPTIAMFMSLSITFFTLNIIFSHSSFLGSMFSNFNFSHALIANPSFSSISGTSYNIFTVLFCITSSFLTLQNSAIFSFIDSSISFSALHTNISGFIPNDWSSFTECCVGFDFNSLEP